MKVARSTRELAPQPRTVAIGTFDGVHLGHRQVIESALAAGPGATVVTFDPHPRSVLGYQVQQLASLERRLELFADLGVPETLVVRFDLELARLEPEGFAESVLRAIGTEMVVAGEAFRFGRGRSGDLALLARLGFETKPVSIREGVSSTAIRQLIAAGDVVQAARLLGRPAEIDGMVVSGDARGGTLGFPTANLAPARELLVPAHGIYAGAAGGHRAAVSIGVNPHYGGEERRIEAFLLDFEGDLYGRRLVVELWERLRDEQAFTSEEELVTQIAQDVERARTASRPA